MKFAYTTGARPLHGYTIKRGIGVGGFGEVYFAISDAGKEVALKRIQRNMDVEVRGVTQCINLKHPNLVALYDIKYDDEGQAWVVMEYVSGDSFRDVLDQHPNGMPLNEVQQWFREIAAGVAYLHDHGIVHRDLKPGNIFLDGDVVKIGDYGLSKYISCSRRSGQTESVGTFHYMAPEIGKGIYGKEIDIYALGVILFEMLTGRVPFEGESSQEIIMKHLTANPDVSSVPVAFRSTIQRSLFKDPEQRYASVSRMLDDVEAGCRIPPVVATPPPESAWDKVEHVTEHAGEPFYIGDESEGIELGPLRETVPARPGESPFRSGSAGKTRPEPIARVVRHAWHGLTSWWDNSNLGTPVKIMLLVGAIFLLVVNAQWLIPTGIVAGAMYLVYYGLRAITLGVQTAPASGPSSGPAAPRSPPVTSPVAVQPVPARSAPPRSYRRKSLKQEIRDHLKQKRRTERATELTGSLFMAAIVSLVLCLVMTLVSNGASLDNVFTWTTYAWLSLTSVAGAWAVLTISKWWESDDGEPFRRRFVMLIAGLITGLAAFGAGEFLGVHLNDEMGVEPVIELPASLVAADGSLTLPAFVVYFAGLFVILRWWLQADPLRESRVSLWATALCVLWAWLIHLFWPFPQPWGFMLAATISIAVQLSAPWVSPRERSRVRGHMAEVV